jgi:uncharacterized protein YjiS (DUF1127 family)
MDVQIVITTPSSLCSFRRARPDSSGQNQNLENEMAFSLSGERSLAAATSANPLVMLMRWIAGAHAAGRRRAALSRLLELDHSRLSDLGISRDDVSAALAAPHRPGLSLNAARARNARR